jgi:hypothetical protein
MNEQFNLINKHGINNVKISKVCFQELASKFLEFYCRICSIVRSLLTFPLGVISRGKYVYVSLPRNTAEFDQNNREEFAQILKEIK